MITDKEMIDLGFKKLKRYNHKKTTGVSVFFWSNNGFILTLEKVSCWNNGSDYFAPTLMVGNICVNFREIEHLKEFLNSLRIF